MTQQMSCLRRDPETLPQRPLRRGGSAPARFFFLPFLAVIIPQGYGHLHGPGTCWFRQAPSIFQAGGSWELESCVWSRLERDYLGLIFNKMSVNDNYQF